MRFATHRPFGRALNVMDSRVIDVRDLHCPRGTSSDWYVSWARDALRRSEVFTARTCVWTSSGNTRPWNPSPRCRSAMKDACRLYGCFVGHGGASFGALTYFVDRVGIPLTSTASSRATAHHNTRLLSVMSWQGKSVCATTRGVMSPAHI